MKTTTTKELISLAGIAIVTPVFALGILISARSVALPESDVSLLAMSLCGVVISGFTGFGRHMAKPEAGLRQAARQTQLSVKQS